MPLACLEHCQMTKCRRFFECEEHWGPDELAEMAEDVLPDPPAVNPPEPTRADWVEPELVEDLP